jgi:hypothetical protein
VLVGFGFRNDNGRSKQVGQGQYTEVDPSRGVFGAVKFSGLVTIISA